MGLSGVPAPVWWAAILGGLGAPVNGTTEANLNAWAGCEGGSAAFNPFNTTEPWPNSSDYNSVGVKNYPSFQAGVQATLATLTNGNYGSIIAALRQSAGRAVFAGAVGSSPWGTSGACIGGSSGVAPPPGGSPGVTVAQGAQTALKRATRDVARAARGEVYLQMYWRSMGRQGWRP